MPYSIASWRAELRPGHGTVLTPDFDQAGVNWTCLDLRPDGSVPVGRCLLWTDVVPTGPISLRQLADTPGDNLGPVMRAIIENQLGLNLATSTFSDIVAELMVDHARTDGSRWKPVRATHDGWYEVWLGGDVPLKRWPRIAGGATLIGDTFTDTNGTTFTAHDGNWTVALGGSATGSATIQTNKGRFSTGTGAYNGYINALYAMSTVATCGVYVELTPNTQAGIESYHQQILRGSGDWPSWNSTTSGYGVNFENGGSKLVEWNGGVASDQTAFSADGWAAGETWAIRFECTGTTIRFRVWDTAGAEPGTWKGSVTDATHASGVWAMWSLNGGDGIDCYHDIDNFVVTDLVNSLLVARRSPRLITVRG